MGLFSVLGTSSSGLQSVQDALSLVSQNIAGANTPGYVRRVQSPSTTASGGVAQGVIERVIDVFVRNSYWRSKTENSYAGMMESALKDVNQLFGKPGSDSGLVSLISKFQSSLQSLNADPTSGAAQQTVIGQAKLLVNAIHNVANGIQSARSNAEAAISSDVVTLQEQLKQIDALNKKISSANGTPDPTILDQRDALVGSISNLIGVNVKTQSDGTVQISTDTGFVLVDEGGAARLTFDTHGELQASDQYDVDPTKRKVGTITATSPSGATVDLLANGLIKSGELGALISLRDDVLVSAQSQIDDLAASLASTFSDYVQTGTANSGGQSLDIAGLQSGNRIHLSYTDASGQVHKVAFVAVNGASHLPLPSSAKMTDGEEVIGIDISQGQSAIASAIQTALNAIGGGLTVASGGGTLLNVTATSPASLTSLSATMTSTGLGDGVKGLPLFVDGQTNLPFTDSYDGISQRQGFASRFSLNSLVAADPAKLLSWGATTGQIGLSRVSELVSRMTTNQNSVSLASQLGLPSGGATIANLVAQIIQTQSIATTSAASIAGDKNTAMNYAEQKFNSVSGVSIDHELANMTALQAAYAANARVMTAAREMLDALMRI